MSCSVGKYSLFCGPNETHKYAVYAECRNVNTKYGTIQSNHWDLRSNSRRQISDNHSKHSVQMVTTGMFQCFIKQGTVETYEYYGVEVYFHVFFTTHRMEIWC